MALVPSGSPFPYSLVESEDLMPPKAPRSQLGRYRLIKKLGIGS